MRLDLSINRLGGAIYTQALQVRDAALAPARPVDTLAAAPDRNRPVLDRVAHGLADTATAVYTTHLSPCNSVSRAYLTVRKYLPIFVVDPALASALLAITTLVNVAGTVAGQAERPDVVRRRKPTLPTVAQRALVLGVLATNLLIFPEAEISGLAASAAVHLGARMLPNRVIAQTPAAWAATGAYIVAAQSVFEVVGLATRPLVATQPRSSTDATCNGLAEICARPLCQTVFPSAHNAMVRPLPFNKVPAPLNMLGMAASDQHLSLDEQFARGIRGFTVEYFPDAQGVLHTSHNTVWTVEPLKDTLVRFRQLLDAHPREVIRLIGSPQGQYNATAVEASFLRDLQDSGLAKYMSSEPSCKVRIDVVPKNGGGTCDLQVGNLIEHNVRAIVMTAGYLSSTFEATTMADFHQFDTVYGPTQQEEPGPAPMVLNLFSTFADWRASDRINAIMPELLGVWVSKMNSLDMFPSMILGSHIETSRIVELSDDMNRQTTLPGEKVPC